jgi:Leucine-rich repeat (LRR) protein
MKKLSSLSRRKILILFIISLFILFLSCVKLKSPTSIAGGIKLNNAALEAAVRVQLNKPTGGLTQADLESITYLDISSSGISSLAGIENCINLKILYMWDNSITDLSPLSGLTGLQSLCAMHNNISSVAAIAGLANLRNLELAGNNISDISQLAPGCVPGGIGHHPNDSLDLASNPLSAQALSVDVPCIETGAATVMVNTSSAVYIEVEVLDISNNLFRAIRKFASSAGPLLINVPDIMTSGSLGGNTDIKYGAFIGDDIIWDVKDNNGAWAPTGDYKLRIISRTAADTIEMQAKNNLVIINSDTCADLHPCVYGTASYYFP